MSVYTCLNPRVNRSVNCGLWAIMVCKCRFMSCYRCTILVGDINNGGDYAFVGIGSKWEISVFSPKLCCEPNCLKKI